MAVVLKPFTIIVVNCKFLANYCSINLLCGHLMNLVLQVEGWLLYAV
jgi:hypothetical protein